MTRVLIGGNSRVVRSALESVLSGPSFSLVGSYSVGDALERIEDLQPDAVVLDVTSAADEAMIFELAADAPAPGAAALVVLTDDAGGFSAVDALRGGVRAVLPRRAAGEEIVAAIQASVAGLLVLHPDTLDSVFSSAVSDGQAELDPPDQVLTPREIEVLRMIADGSSNKQIASRLSISDHTVKFHIGSIFTKLGASNRAEAVSIGIRRGLLMV